MGLCLPAKQLVIGHRAALAVAFVNHAIAVAVVDVIGGAACGHNLDHGQAVVAAILGDDIAIGLGVCGRGGVLGQHVFGGSGGASGKRHGQNNGKCVAHGGGLKCGWGKYATRAPIFSPHLRGVGMPFGQLFTYAGKREITCLGSNFDFSVISMRAGI